MLVIGWVEHAERKAAVTLAAAGVVGGLLFNLVHNSTGSSVWLNALATGCATLAIGSAVSAGLALVPRLKSHESATSPLYFHHIARSYPRAGGSDEYVRTLCAVFDDRSVGSEIARQTWSNAHVARSKYRWSGVAIVALWAATLALAASALVVALASV